MDAPEAHDLGSSLEDDEPVAVAAAVQAVVVAYDPGPWFEECLASLVAQDYPQLALLVVDAGSTSPVEARVRSVAPEATITRLEEPKGFGPSVNAVLEQVAGSAPFLLLCHDDVRLHPDAVRYLVEEAYRHNAGVLGPKLVAWEDDSVLVHVGAAIDKTGVPAPIAEPGERDQEQHDAVRDVSMVTGGVQLVRTDLFVALEGFDPTMDLLGEELDLCWRAAVAGGRVVVVPRAVAAHRASLTERRGIDDRRRRLARSRLRTMLTCYGPAHRFRVLPQAALLAFVEALLALLLGHLSQCRDVLGAWVWNARHLRGTRARRRVLRKLRRVPDRDIRSLQVRGSARVNAFVRGQIGSDHRRGGIAGLHRALGGPWYRTALAGWATVILVLGVGGRHLATRGVPPIGEFASISSGSALVEQVLGAYRDGWAGADAAAPTPLVLLALPALLIGGGLLHQLLLLSMLPIGAIGAWRLGTPMRSRPASVVLMLAYVSVPLGTDAMARGSLSGLVAYAAAPWMLARFARAARIEPFTDRQWGVTRDLVSTGVMVALVLTFAPGAAVALGVLVVGLVVGSILALHLRGVPRLLGVCLGAAWVVAALHGAWAIELGRAGWEAAMGQPGAMEQQVGIGSLLRFEIGTTRVPTAAWLLPIAAVLPLLIARDWRFGWAVRAWSVAFTSWGLAWAASAGWVPIATPDSVVLLAPAALAMALAAALGIVAVLDDLPDYHLGWRQFAAILALASLSVSLLPMLGRVADGQWGMPRGSFDPILTFADPHYSDEGHARVLWIGSPDVVHGDVRSLIPGTVVAVTPQASSSFVSLWPAAATIPDERLRSSVLDAVTGRSGRLGQALAVHGVRWVIAPQQGAPVPHGGVVAPTDPAVLDALAQQLDLAPVEVNAAVVVYRNEAWVPTVSVLDSAEPVDPVLAAPPGEPMRLRPALRASALYPNHRGTVAEGAVLRVASGSQRWLLDLDAGNSVAPEVTADGVLTFAVPETGEGGATLRHQPLRVLQGAAAAQALAWLLALGALLRWRSREEADAALHEVASR